VRTRKPPHQPCGGELPSIGGEVPKAIPPPGTRELGGEDGGRGGSPAAAAPPPPDVATLNGIGFGGDRS